jgi:parvulin-like peptidyl-prolyl isomerase
MKRRSGQKEIVEGKTGIQGIMIIVPLLLFLLGSPTVRSLADDGGTGKTGPEGVGSTVAARVNGIEIPMKSVTLMMNQMSARMGRGHSAPKVSEELRKRALDMLILQELAWQKVDRREERERIDEKISSLKARSGGEEEYGKLLEKEGLSESEAAMLVEKGMVFDRMIQKEVFGKVKVSEDALRKEYDKEKERFHTPEKVEVIDVVFFLEPGDKESMRKAEEILKRIKDMKDKNPLTLTPDGTFIVREIDLRKEKEGQLYEVAKKLQVDELSGVVTTLDSLHILQLKKITPEKLHTFDQVKASLEGKLKMEAMRKSMQEWEAELKRGATIEIPGTGDSPK